MPSHPNDIGVRTEVGKYVNREKRKVLPEGHDRWEFACRVGPEEATATSIEITGPNNTLLIDAVDKLTATSAGNSITYKRGLSGPRANVITTGDNNIVTQSGRPGYR